MGEEREPVTCRRCREAVSARLDGEESPDDTDPSVDAHLAGCGECRAFAEGAAQVTRLARTRPAEDVPDLVPALLDAWRPPRRRRWPLDLVRAGLAAVAVGQLAIALVGIVTAARPDAAMTAAMGTAMGTTMGTAMDTAHLNGASAVHFSHESAAWNLALGVAFAGVALRRHRPVAGLVTTVAAFVGVLAALSVPDLLAGRVDAERLLGHGLVVVGLGLLLIHRTLVRRDGGTVPGSRRSPADPAPSSTPRFGPPFRVADDAQGPAAPGFEPTGRKAA